MHCCQLPTARRDLRKRSNKIKQNSIRRLAFSCEAVEDLPDPVPARAPKATSSLALRARVDMMVCVGAVAT